MSGKNGNLFKGNVQQKKQRKEENKEQYRSRNKKKSIIDVISKEDQYAFIDSLDGGKHAKVILIESIDRRPIIAVIPGKFHKRVWFKKGDVVIVSENGNLFEIKGKANEAEANQIRAKFDKGDEDESLVFEGEDLPPPQPKRNFDLSEIESDGRRVTLDDI